MLDLILGDKYGKALKEKPVKVDVGRNFSEIDGFVIKWEGRFHWPKSGGPEKRAFTKADYQSKKKDIDEIADLERQLKIKKLEKELRQLKDDSSPS